MTKLRALPASGAHLRRRAKAGSIKVLPLVASQGRSRVKLGRECVAAYETAFFGLERFLFFRRRQELLEVLFR